MSVFMYMKSISSTCLLLCLLMLPLGGDAAPPPDVGGMGAPRTLPAGKVRRAAVLFLGLPGSASDGSTVRRADIRRIMDGKRRRRSGRRRPAPAIPRETPVSPASGTDSSLETASPQSIRSIVGEMLQEAVAEQLFDTLGITVVPDAEVKAALVALGISPEEAHRPEGARALCARLECDASLTLQLLDFSLQESSLREVGVWGKVTVDALRWYEAPREPPSGAPSGPDSRALPFAGGSSAERTHTHYRKPRARLIREALFQAARMAVHVLRTGEIPPFVRRNERVAVLPTQSPETADALIFAAQGRQIVPHAVEGLPADASRLFAPNLRPLTGDAILQPAACRRAAAEAALWPEEAQLDTRVAREIGLRLGVDYILSARIIDLELAEEPDQNVRDARAEAMGVLVRVSDGAVLWQDRVTAAANGHIRPTSAVADSSRRDLAHSALRFVLMQLRRSLHAYRARFEQG